MVRASTRDPTHVPFALYHGTSSHYIANFQPGKPLSNWRYKRDALELYRRVWTELRRLGQNPEWWQEKILDQVSEYANWQHGQLYVTPSRMSAVRYAIGGAAHGGELLQLCREAINDLSKLQRSKADGLLNGMKSVGHLLTEIGQPIVIEFEKIQVCGLSAERSSDDVRARIDYLEKMDDKKREIMGQQANFRLAPDCCVVGRVFDVLIDD